MVYHVAATSATCTGHMYYTSSTAPCRLMGKCMQGKICMVGISRVNIDGGGISLDFESLYTLCREFLLARGWCEGNFHYLVPIRLAMAPPSATLQHSTTPEGRACPSSRCLQEPTVVAPPDPPCTSTFHAHPPLHNALMANSTPVRVCVVAMHSRCPPPSPPLPPPPCSRQHVTRHHQCHQGPCQRGHPSGPTPATQAQSHLRIRGWDVPTYHLWSSQLPPACLPASTLPATTRHLPQLPHLPAPPSPTTHTYTSSVARP
jgi:hypothetical protein